MLRDLGRLNELGSTLARVLPNLLKGWGVCYHVYVIGAHKRTHVDCQNIPNHCTSIYHEWMCVCVAALKVIVTRYTAQSVMRTCMIPRELIWERVALSHTGVTQNSGWPLLQLLWSAPEKAQSLMWCAISNVVSLSLSLISKHIVHGSKSANVKIVKKIIILRILSTAA